MKSETYNSNDLLIAYLRTVGPYKSIEANEIDLYVPMVRRSTQRKAPVGHVWAYHIRYTILGGGGAFPWKKRFWVCRTTNDTTVPMEYWNGFCWTRKAKQKQICLRHNHAVKVRQRARIAGEL